MDGLRIGGNYYYSTGGLVVVMVLHSYPVVNQWIFYKFIFNKNIRIILNLLKLLEGLFFTKNSTKYMHCCFFIDPFTKLLINQVKSF